jgi:signal transduction histidine kinase
MDQNVERLLNLINQLLDFRKAENKGFKLNPKEYNIGTIFLGLPDDTIFIEDSSIQEVIHIFASALDGDIQILINGEVFEQHTVPVIVWEQVGICIGTCFIYLIPAIERLILLVIGNSLIINGFIIHIHVSRAICHFLHIGRHGESIIKADIYRHFLGKLSLLGSNDDNSVSPPVSRIGTLP